MTRGKFLKALVGIATAPLIPIPMLRDWRKETLNRLSRDLASFHNLGIKETVGILTKAFTGRTENLKKFGVKRS